MAVVKTKDIAKQNGFTLELFEQFLLKNKNRFKVESGVFSKTVAEEDVARAVEEYKKERAAIDRAQAEAARKEREHRQAIASMLVTSGFNFDGYTVTRYSGYISGDDATQINRDKLFAQNGQILTDALVKIRVQAMKELKEAAYDLGCNAIVGVDFDYLTFEPETNLQPYVVCVTANGNAVVIEKNE